MFRDEQEFALLDRRLLPELLARRRTLQVIDYFQAFLIGRVGWTRFNALLIIPGAFGLFQRTASRKPGLLDGHRRRGR
jgi:hypothetical protein